MTRRRAVSGALLGFVLAVAAPAAASAAPGDYPGGNNASLAVSATVAGVGSTITVTGSGFPPGPVTITSTVVAQGFGRGAPAFERLGALRPAGAAQRPAAAVQRLAAVAGCSTGVTCEATANAAGVFSVAFTLTQAGTTVITASGGGVVLSQTVQVGAGSGAGGGSGGGSGSGSGAGSGTGSGSGAGSGGLPNTGASIGLPVTLGAILVLAGAGLLTVVRRRKSKDVPA
jgi:LPXTG-motif cell wall-anchored protein